MKDFLKKTKYYIIAAVVIIAALVIAFISGGNVEQAAKSYNNAAEHSVSSPDEAAPVTSADVTAATTVPDITKETQTTTATADVSGSTAATAPTDIVAASEEAENRGSQTASQPQQGNQNKAINQTDTARQQAPKAQDKYKTDPTPTDKPQPVEPQERKITNKRHRCTISISCASIYNHQEQIDNDILEVQPTDGWIMKPTTVTVNEGESVFDVLQKTCKRKGILMEFSDTPMYNSAYIEGINNLYEFDCGPGSGWMYKVNGWYPNYGCSRYAVQDGDVIEWVYTCNMGYDIGGGNQYN